MKKLTKAKATAALRAICKQFAVDEAEIGAGRGPQLVQDYEPMHGGTVDYAIVWEEGPYEWTYGAFWPHIDTETGLRREGVVKPAGVYSEAINTYALGLYHDDSLAENTPETWAEIDAHYAARKAEREAQAAAEAAEVKGMPADIYRSRRGDASNGGISSQADRVTLVGPGVPRIAKPTEDAPAVELAETTPGYVVVRPADRPDTWWMAGGTFVYSSDSRWPTGQPIPLHDRTESAELTRLLST